MATGHQERIDIHTDPRIVHEHVLRYRFALPAIAESDVWVDLGCGGGLAGAAALDGAAPPKQTLLVDIDTESLKVAKTVIGGTAETRRVDLATEDGIADLEPLLLTALEGRSGCLTCFEVLEHLNDFVPFVGLLRRVAELPEVTVVMSIPNDSFWSMHNPHHKTSWSGDAFEEFKRLLPADIRVAHQTALGGSCVQPLDGSSDGPTYELSVKIREDGVPTHHLLALGAMAQGLSGVAKIEQVDLDAQRAWERQRDADLEWLRQREEDLVYYETEAKRLAQELEAMRAANSAS